MMYATQIKSPRKQNVEVISETAEQTIAFLLRKKILPPALKNILNLRWLVCLMKIAVVREGHVIGEYGNFEIGEWVKEHSRLP